ncbi:MAG: hypothetical protein HY458_00065 [Parcubacteria group bacterium]|nr:hypothetical protein [Parcubacteria group bacterium]
MKNPSAFLLKSAEQERMSHAYLLSGNAKERKLKSVRELLRYLLGEYTDTHRDVLWVTEGPAIAKVQEIRRFASLTPAQSPFRIVVIQEAQDMGKESQAALLKILEEPSSSVLFFLLAHPAQLLSSPLRSRLQNIPFFSPYAEPNKEQEAYVKELSRLKKSSLRSRLAFAKEKAEDAEHVISMLEAWQDRLHTLFLEKSRVSAFPVSLQTLLERMQESWLMLRTTNVNTRLALEHVLLAL